MPFVFRNFHNFRIFFTGRCRLFFAISTIFTYFHRAMPFVFRNFHNFHNFQVFFTGRCRLFFAISTISTYFSQGDAVCFSQFPQFPHIFHRALPFVFRNFHNFRIFSAMRCRLFFAISTIFTYFSQGDALCCVVDAFQAFFGKKKQLPERHIHLSVGQRPM